jgi:hypothetical protein
LPVAWDKRGAVTQGQSRWVARPEARWALWAGIAGALAAAALSVKGIFSSGSSTASLGFLFVPLIAAVAAVPTGIWGAALGHVVLHMRGRVYSPRPVFIAALLAAASLPLTIGYEIWQGVALERAAREARSMNASQLEESFAASAWRRNKFFLGILASHESASGSLLARIAELDDEELYDRMGSLWDVMGENRKGLAVMRLVARNPNTPGATLQRLEAGPHAGKLITELLANPNTPAPVLAKHAGDTHYLAEWGLALNPNAPVAVMERLSRSNNHFARMNLTYNKATPRGILERLAQDPDPVMARNAKLALERRK